MEMTWENLTTLFTWAAQHKSRKRTLIVAWPPTRNRRPNHHGTEGTAAEGVGNGVTFGGAAVGVAEAKATIRGSLFAFRPCQA